jgi:hypothetical protein
VRRRDGLGPEGAFGITVSPLLHLIQDPRSCIERRSATEKTMVSTNAASHAFDEQWRCIRVEFLASGSDLECHGSRVGPGYCCVVVNVQGRLSEDKK